MGSCVCPCGGYANVIVCVYVYVCVQWLATRPPNAHDNVDGSIARLSTYHHIESTNHPPVRATTAPRTGTPPSWSRRSPSRGS